MTMPEWWDKNVSMGNLASILMIAFLVGSFYMSSEKTHEFHAERIDRSEIRIEKIEKLQIAVAEVVVQQQNIINRMASVETQVSETLDGVRRRLDHLEEEE